jgi:hypothetical protein
MSQAVLRVRTTPTLLSLRNVLRFDAFTCLAMGVLLLGLPSRLANLFALPPALLWWAGVVLLPCAALMWIAARLASQTTLLAKLVVAGNVAWVIASIAVVIEFNPSTLGLLFVLAQAAAVVVIAALEYRELRRSPAAT